MTTTTLYPLQPNYVTKKEFSEFKSYVGDGFDLTNEHIDNLEKHIDSKFTNLEDKVDNLEKVMNTKFAEQKGYTASLKTNLTSLTKAVNKIEKQLVDQREDTVNLNQVVNKIADKILEK